jgi:hypothetical protein
MMNIQAALLYKKQETKSRIVLLFFVIALLGAALVLSGCPNPANTETFVPSTPAVPTVTAGDQQLTVRWAAVEDAAAYEVWYGTTADSGAAEKHAEDIPGLTTTIGNLINDTTYYAWIKAKNSAGTSGFSPFASGTPQAPVVAPAVPAVPAITAGDSELTVSWTAEEGATAYEVWYGTEDDSGAAEKHGEDIPGLTTTIGSLTNDTIYYIWVKAKNSAGTSGFSPSASKAPFAGVNDATLSRFRPAGPNKLYRQHVFPKFAPANENYTMPVDYWVNSIQLEVTTTQTGATVTSPTATATAQSGKVFTLSYALNNGDNNISITATAPDGITTKTYAIVINRDTFYGSGTSMPTCTGTENVIPEWLLGFWSFVYDSDGNIEDLTITDLPSVSADNLGRMEFGMGMGMPWIAGDIVYSKEFSSRSGILILQLDPNAGAMNPIDDPTGDGTGFYAIYYFNMVGDGDFGSSARIFQSNQIGSGGGVPAYATLAEAKAKFIVDKWYSINLTTIDMVGDPQIKRPDDWVWDGRTVDWRED